MNTYYSFLLHIVRHIESGRFVKYSNNELQEMFRYLDDYIVLKFNKLMPTLQNKYTVNHPGVLKVFEISFNYI